MKLWEVVVYNYAKVSGVKKINITPHPHRARFLKFKKMKHRPPKAKGPLIPFFLNTTYTHISKSKGYCTDGWI
jgi:hypothetical protein